MTVQITGIYKEYNISALPSIHHFVNSQAKSIRKLPWKIRFYLKNSPCIAAAVSGCSTSLFNPDISIEHGARMLTDGKWVWFGDIVYYYEYCQVDFEPAFQAHLNSLYLPYPLAFSIKNQLSRGQLLRDIDATLEEVLANKTTLTLD